MTRRALEAAFALRNAGTAALDPLRRWRHRGAAVVHTEPIAEAQPRELEGYPTQLWAPSGDRRGFHLRSPHADNTLVLERYLESPRAGAANGSFLEVGRETFGANPQADAPAAPVSGCGWPVALEVETDGWAQGTYRARIETDGADLEDASPITFLIGPAEPSARVAVFAPVSTWLAYNPYGGQSLYHNERGPETTIWAHAHRPNPALGWDPVGVIHSMRAEAPVHAWLDLEVGADLYPDWMLEHPERLESYDVLALASHCEYASDAMVDGLRSLVKGGRTLLALGGNQLYWRVRWNAEHTQVECRKDGSRFQDGTRGGLWRQRGKPEDALLGVRFTPPGTGTYAPYRVEDAGHWLMRGLEVENGDLFGLEGTTPLPICGDETDAPSRTSARAAEVVARGLNRPDAIDGDYTIWHRRDPAWDGSAGGTIAWTPFSDRHGVLATGAIHSPSGLGRDAVFTGIVRNALDHALR
ncbi:N,N-dimethylformamidase beta subunit family domain-containing protein [Rubrivirga sp.]|uniref:N,N-dimethylformamidase beta subunit family domain-containing protein n=1 Tax=Rubrivirga sp. TaxID=1885344 RepID=UPI003C729161